MVQVPIEGVCPGKNINCIYIGHRSNTTQSGANSIYLYLYIISSQKHRDTPQQVTVVRKSCPLSRTRLIWGDSPAGGWSEDTMSLHNYVVGDTWRWIQREAEKQGAK